MSKEIFYYKLTWIICFYQAIVLYLHTLPANRKNVPELIKDPVALIQDVRNLISIHRLDVADLAISGKPILWVQVNENDQESKKSNVRGLHSLKNNTSNGGIKPPKIPALKGEKRSPHGDKGGPRRRRTRYLFTFYTIYILFQVFHHCKKHIFCFLNIENKILIIQQFLYIFQ